MKKFWLCLATLTFLCWLSLLLPSRAAACAITFLRGNRVRPGDSLPVRVEGTDFLVGSDHWDFDPPIPDYQCVEFGNFFGGTVDTTVVIPTTATPGTYRLIVHHGLCITWAQPECDAPLIIDLDAPPAGISNPCGTASSNSEFQACMSCLNQGNAFTALGCIKTQTPSLFVAWLLRWAMGIGGGIALLLIIFGGFQIITSAGNPEKVKSGKDIITSAIAGLLLIIFSIFILEIIGVRILQLPGLSL